MAEKVYFICLGFGLIFTVLCLVFGHFFGGHDVDSDVGTGGHAEAGFADSGVPALSFFSPTVLATFVTAFGAIGSVLSRIDATSNVWISAPLSALGGLGIASAALFVFNLAFRKTQGSSESKVGKLVGHEANVISPIPQDGVGEIAYIQGGSRYNAPARTENGVAVGSGKMVRIKKIVGGQFYVEVIDQSLNHHQKLPENNPEPGEPTI